ADQFRNLVAVLKFAAVDLDDSMRIPEQGFGRGLDKMRFARARRAKKQQASQWPSRCGQTGPASLEDVDDRPDCPVLADNFRAQRFLELQHFCATLFAIEQNLFRNHWHDHNQNLAVLIASSPTQL